MHDFHHGKLPLPFNETWISNRICNPELVLRNADNLYVPPHHYVTTKRFPLFTFPRSWNEAAAIKLNPSQRVFVKNVKSAMLNSIIAKCYVFPPLPHPTPAPLPHQRRTYPGYIRQIW
jgi:hypothetical protein